MATDAGTGVRYLVVLAVVGAWMVAGTALHLSSNAYLLLGVPLLLVFQLGIARRPLAELWFKEPSGAPLPWWGWLTSAAFMVAPGYYLVRGWSRDAWSVHLWMICAAAGAIPLGYSVTRLSRAALKALLLCCATAGVLGVLMMLGGTLFRHELLPAAGSSASPHSPWFVGFRSFVLYVPVCFVLEEVFFRGGLDSYLHRPADRVPWVSAAFVSALWGLWHLPGVVARIPSARSSAGDPVVVFVILLGSVTVLPLVHCVIGIPLSLGWRRSGLLFVPALVHALIDAVRNGLLNWH
jgi:Type II CAAX prenyl endopeptidase Rce1-like